MVSFYPLRAAALASALALCFFFQPVAGFGQNDLSGVWRGERHMAGQTALWEMNLAQTGENSYTGITVLYWRKNGDQTPYETIHPIKKFFLAKLESNSMLKIVEMDTLEMDPKVGFAIGRGEMKLQQGSQGPELVTPKDPPGSVNFARIVHTSEPFPAAFAKYVVKDPNFRIDAISVVTPDDKKTLVANEKVRINISVQNTIPINFKNLTIRLTTAEKDNGIEHGGDLHTNFNLRRNTNDQPPSVLIATNFLLPRGGIHFTATISLEDVVLATGTLTVPTDAFFQTDQVAVPAAGSPRMQALAGYFGYGSAPYSVIPAKLDPLAAGGDKIATMWKAVCLSMGYGGYKIDEDEGYNLGLSCIKAVEDKARQGDAEAIYLLFYACQMGLEGESAKGIAGSFLEKAAVADLRPAVYDEGLQYIWHKNYPEAFKWLVKSYEMGDRKAAMVIGMMYERGLSVGTDVDSAMTWYKRGMAFGDPDALLCYAKLCTKGIGNTPPDVGKAIGLAKEAAAKNCTDAMIFIGKVYLDGNQGVTQDIPAAIKWFKAGAELGDRQAMLALGETYVADIPGMTKDLHSGLFWIKKAAEAGSPKAMLVLARAYIDGSIGEKNVILGRYWYNQAVQNGYAQADQTAFNAQRESFLNFWKYADFSPSYVYVNEYGNQVGTSDDGLLNGLFSGLMGAMFSYYGNQQQLIDGLEFVERKNGYRIYGGTVSSHFLSTLVLKQGQAVAIRAYGIVSTGMMSGPATADGLGNAWAEYRIIKNIPCSAVMATVQNNNDWKFIGQNGMYTAPQDGALAFALNAIDYRNYKGYFDLVVRVPEK